MLYVPFFLLVTMGLIFPKSKFLSYVLLLMDWIMFAFARGQADFEAYRIYYERSSINLFRNEFKSVEIGYQFLCAFARDFLHMEFEMFWSVCAAISLLMLFNIIRRYTKNCAIVLALFSMFPLLISIVQWRMWLGIIIVLFGIRYLESDTIRGYVIYGAFALVASTIHLSCIFFFTFLLCKIRNEKLIEKGVFIWCVIASPLLQPILMRLTKISGIANKYLNQYTNTTKLYTQFFMLILLLTIYYASSTIRNEIIVGSSVNEGKLSVMQQRQKDYATLAVKISLCAFIIWPFTAFTLETMRFVRCFIIVLYILLGIAISYLDFKVWNQQFVRVIIPALSVSLMYTFSYRDHYLYSVFLPIMNNNILIERIFK